MYILLYVRHTVIKYIILIFIYCFFSILNPKILSSITIKVYDMKSQITREMNTANGYYVKLYENILTHIIIVLHICITTERIS